MIDENVLIEYGAVEREYNKGDQIFSQNQTAKEFYQISNGEVKMSCFSEDGKEFIQGIFSEGRSFGEPPLFGEFSYPVNAVALKHTRLLCLGKAKFLRLLNDHPEIHLKVTETLAERLYYKAIMATEMSIHQASHRVLTLLDYLKHDIYKLEGRFNYEVELTRQQIGDLTGLRVETVIRVMKELEDLSEIQIVNRKVLR